MSNHELLTKFKLDNKYGLSNDVMERYLSTMRRFFRHCPKDYSEVKSNDILEWAIALYALGISNNSIIIYLCTLRLLYRYALEEKLVKHNPTYKLKMPWATEPKPTKNYWVVNNEKISRENRVIINDFLTSLKIENKSASTAEQYSKGLERFFLHCQKEIGELTSDDIKDWLDARYWDKKPKTISSAISILSSFFTFCESEEYIDKKLIKNSWRPKIPHTLPIYLEKNDQARVKISAETTTLRDRLILELLLSSGCRRSELAKLNTEDIDTSNKTAWVMGKGGKARIVHFSETCTILLEEYLSIHPDDEQALYLNRLGNRLDDNGIYRVISKIGKQANLSSKLYPHRLRHTFATNLLAKGEELVYISDKLGHKDLNTTRIYARLPQEVIISLYRKYMG